MGVAIFRPQAAKWSGLSDHKILVSSVDTTAGYLYGKLVAGSDITITKLNSGLNEQISIAYSGTATGFLKLDQTTPQTTIGTFTFPSIVATDLIPTTDYGLVHTDALGTLFIDSILRVNATSGGLLSINDGVSGFTQRSAETDFSQIGLGVATGIGGYSYIQSNHSGTAVDLPFQVWIGTTPEFEVATNQITIPSFIAAGFVKSSASGVLSVDTTTYQIAGSYELSTNKATDFLTINNTLYPSVQATKTYVDGMVAGLLDYRGAYNASVNAYPTTGGSGTAGAILKGDMWVISVAGTMGTVVVQIGDAVIANTDTPGQTDTNWNVLEANVSYVPEDQANKVTTISALSTNIQYPSAKLLYDQLILKQNSLGTGTGNQYLQMNGGVLGFGSITLAQGISGSIQYNNGSNIADGNRALLFTPYVSHNGNFQVGSQTAISAMAAFGQGTTGPGTVTITNTTDVAGTGTKFTDTFKVGDSIIITATSETKAITAITSDTVMTIAAATNTVASAYTLTGGMRFAVFGNGLISAGATILPYDFTFSSNANKTFGIEPTANNVAGKSLNILAGSNIAGGTADLDGGMLTLSPGVPKGTGKTSVRLQRSTRAASTGTGLNALVDSYVSPSIAPLANNTNRNLFTVACPTDSGGGGQIHFTIIVTDTTNHLVNIYTGQVKYIFYDQNGVEAGTITEESNQVKNGGAGHTVTWVITVASNVATIIVKSNASALNPQAIHEIAYSVENNSRHAITQL